jgi:hypothetical protein
MSGSETNQTKLLDYVEHIQVYLQEPITRIPISSTIADGTMHNKTKR